MSETTSTPDSTPIADAPPSSAPPSAPAPATEHQPSSGPDSQPSPPSGDSHQSDREGLLAAVRKVVSTEPEKPALPSDEATPDADTGEAGDKEPDHRVAAGEGQEPSHADKPQDEPVDLNAPDPSEGELKKLRPETRKRFERLLAQRNQARQQLAQIQPELDAHRKLRGYLDQHQLAPDDVNMLLGVGASLRRGDWQAFLQGVTPYVLTAQEALGIRIAPDLQRQVDEGLVSEDAAKELTRTRHRALRAEHTIREQTTQAAQTVASHNAAATKQAIDNWEIAVRARDPDYEAFKSGAVRRYSQALMHERGVPQTPEQAVALVQSAYDEATRELARLRPRPQATRATPSGIQTSTNGATAPLEPRTMKDAALMALANMRRAS